MLLSVLSETTANERRVALVPDSVGRLVKSGLTVTVQSGAGLAAGFTDAAYEAAGATIAPDAASAVTGAVMVAKVQPPSAAEVELLPAGVATVSLLQPSSHVDLIAQLNARGVKPFSLEMVPRISRAQSMDVLSSQSTVTGYKAVLVGASALGKLLPMLTTAAGTLAPAKVFVLGAGVAGLQAIATARRLGAVVSAFDVRPAAMEQVASLGASFVAGDLVSATSEGTGGYARAQTEEEQAKVREALAEALSDFSGAIVLVSHDRHLTGLVCDTFWRVADGKVEEFDGDLDEYSAWLRSRGSNASDADEKPRKSATPARAHEKASASHTHKSKSGKKKRKAG